MKKITKIVLCILLALLLAAAGVCWWQWDNIMAVKTSMTHSREDIAGMMAESGQKIEESTQKVEGIIVRDLTEEEKLALKNGDVDRDTLLESMTSGGAEDSTGADASDRTEGSAATDEGGETAAETAPHPSDESLKKQDQQKLSRYLAEIYLMKAEYTSWLEDKHEAAIEEYNALDESERTTAAKYSIGMRYMQEALEKEKECDALMADMEQKILELLTEMEEDTSLVDDIHAAYEEEKALKKAYYLGLHD